MTKTIAARCEGQIAEGRRCARKTKSGSGYCGVCKGKKQKQQTPDRRTRRPAAAKKRRGDRRKVDTARPKPYDRAATALATSYQNLLDKHGGKWEAMWQRVAPFLASRNSVTGAAYSGSNQLLLAIVGVDRGYKTPNWATYKQWKTSGGQVRKGAKGVLCLRPQKLTLPHPDYPDDPDKSRTVIYYRPFTAFNLDDIDFPAGQTPPHVYTPQPPEGAAGMISEQAAAAGAKIVHQPVDMTLAGAATSAFYSPDRDLINMPPRELFETDEDYAGTLLHELAHWTGHPSRCNRVKGKQFGDEKYAQEELTAELVAWVAAEKWGISLTGKQQHNHASYLASWEPGAGDDPKKLLKAAARAGKALRYMEKVGLLPAADEVENEQRLAA